MSYRDKYVKYHPHPKLPVKGNGKETFYHV